MLEWLSGVPRAAVAAFLISASLFQVLMSVPCVLVTPKRKLGGRLAVMKSVLHFFSEFLVEGTGGSSVFKSFHDSGKPDQLGEDQKQKLNFNLDSDKGNASEIKETVHGNVLQKQPKNIKRHRRWNICKVRKLYIVFSDFIFRKSLFLQVYFYFYFFQLVISGKGCPLDSVLA